MSEGFVMAGASDGTAFRIVLPALVGLIAGAVGGLWAAWQRTRVFKAEWTRSRQDMRVSKAVELIQNLSTGLARLSHEMWWLSWRALHDATRVGAREIDEWEHHTHELLPNTLGMLAALHAVSPKSGSQIEGAMDDILLLISDLSRAAVPVRYESPEKKESRAALAALHPRAEECVKKVRQEVGGAAAAVLDDLRGSAGAIVSPDGRRAWWR